MTGIFDLARDLKSALDEQEDLFGSCLGPPCRHFPGWVKTAADAHDYLAYQVLRAGSPYLNRPLRSLDEVLAERERKERGE